MMKSKQAVALVAIAATGFVMAGCGTASTNNSTQNATGANQTHTTSNPSSSTDANKTITFGYMNWDEDVAATFLWKQLLTQRGYKVNLVQMGPGPVWLGLSNGSLDAFMDTWMPYVDKTYMQKYGSKLVNLGKWYGGTTQEGFVVPDYMSNIKTMADLRQHANEFGKVVVGIESGSTEMGQAKQAIKDYNLPFTLQASSTPAMLAELQKDYQAKKPIVVTLWSPHWAFAKYHLHYISDPKQDFGKPGVIDTVVTKQWQAAHPEAAGWLKNFHLNVQQLGTLEEDIAKHPNDKMAGVQEWVQNNSSLVNSWFPSS